MKVRYTTSAAAELVQVLDHIAEHSPYGANKVQSRLKAMERMLMAFPEIGAQSKDRPWLRRLVLRPFPYLIFYEIADGEVWIHRVRHGARDWE